MSWSNTLLLRNTPMLILGGFVTPTYDEVRVYSRALTHAEIITSINERSDIVPEFGNVRKLNFVAWYVNSCYGKGGFLSIEKFYQAVLPLIRTEIIEGKKFDVG